LVLEVQATQVREHQAVVLYSALLPLLVVAVVAQVVMVVQVLALALLVARVVVVVVLVIMRRVLQVQVTHLLYLHHKAIVVARLLQQVLDTVLVVEGVQVLQE
jgi:hypothetical protein